MPTDYTKIKKTIQFKDNSKIIIKKSDIKARIEGFIKAEQVYTFGPSIPNRWVSVGKGTNTIAYSNDGVNWNGLGTNIFSVAGNGAEWNGTMWVAVGEGTNTIAYSYDGIIWTGLGKSIFSTAGRGVAWNGKMWVAVGEGTNVIAYSFDGIIWFPGVYQKAGKQEPGDLVISMSVLRGVAWNGKMWVAVGSGIRYYIPPGSPTPFSVTIISSSDGINWNCAFGPIFSDRDSLYTEGRYNTTGGFGVAWNGSMWLAVGDGSRSSAVYYSKNGIIWTAVGLYFSDRQYRVQYGFGVSAQNENLYLQNIGYGVSWNGKAWVIVGYTPYANPNSISGKIDSKIYYVTSAADLNYYTNGISAALVSIVGVAWNGTMWVAVGKGIDYYDASTPVKTTFCSLDGINWIYPGQYLFNSQNINNHNINYNNISSIFDLPGRTDPFTTCGNGIAFNAARPYKIKFPANLTLALGQGTNTMVYSNNDIDWIQVPGSTNIFSIAGRGAAWNGTRWVAVGEGTNTIAYSSNGINWTPVTESTTIFSTAGYGVEWNGTMFVAVGKGTNTITNTIAYSKDGLTWTPATDGVFSMSGRGIAWNGKMWIAVGKGTKTITANSISTTVDYSIVYSSDGVSWNAATNNPFSTSVNTETVTNDGGYSVAWNGTRWVAVGQGTNHTMAYSNDGIWWTGLGKNIFSTTGSGVAWNGSLWVAVGSGTNTIAYSNDGITWTGLGTNSPLSTAGYGVTWTGTAWLAVGGPGTVSRSVYNGAGNLIQLISGQGTVTMAYSYDGITWTKVTDSEIIFSSTGNAVKWNAGLYSIESPPVPKYITVAVGQGTNTIAYSLDGSNNWIAVTGSTNIFSTAGRGVAWNGTMWVAVGQGTNTIACSGNGINWAPVTNSTSIFSTMGWNVTWNGKIWLAVGEGTNKIAYSTDALTWTPVTNANNIFGGNSVRDAAWNGSIWVAVGQNQTSTSEDTTSIAYSVDGISKWTSVSGSTNIFSNTGNAIAWNGTRFVAVGQGGNTIAYSLDGSSNWTAVTGSTSIFSNAGRGVAWNGTRWVAVGQGTTNTIAYSNDGISWTAVTGSTSIFSTSGRGVSWNGKRFIAVGEGTNSIAYSVDGVSWSPVTGSTSNFFATGYKVAINPNAVEPTVSDEIVLNAVYPQTNGLDIVADSYYTPGYSNFSVNITATEV